MLWLVLTFSGARTAFGLAGLAAGLAVILDLRTIIYTSRHIHLYQTRRNNAAEDHQHDHGEDVALEYDANQEEQTNLAKTVEGVKWTGNPIIAIFTNPFLDMTISERASKLRQYVKCLSKQLSMLEKNPAIQILLLNRWAHQVQSYFSDVLAR